MKMLWIMCNESVSEEVQEVLEESGARGYTLWTDVRGVHAGCKRHWGDAVFPGFNHVFSVVDDDEKVEELSNALRRLKEQPAVGRAGLKAFVQRVEEEI